MKVILIKDEKSKATILLHGHVHYVHKIAIKAKCYQNQSYVKQNRKKINQRMKLNDLSMINQKQLINLLYMEIKKKQTKKNHTFVLSQLEYLCIYLFLKNLCRIK